MLFNVLHRLPHTLSFGSFHTRSYTSTSLFHRKFLVRRSLSHFQFSSFSFLVESWNFHGFQLSHISTLINVSYQTILRNTLAMFKLISFQFCKEFSVKILFYVPCSLANQKGRSFVFNYKLIKRQFGVARKNCSTRKKKVERCWWICKPAFFNDFNRICKWKRSSESENWSRWQNCIFINSPRHFSPARLWIMHRK